MFAPAALADSVPEAVARALRGSHQVQAYVLEGKAALADTAAVAGVRRPRLGGSAQAGGNGTANGEDYSAGVSVTLAQPIYDGGEIASNLLRSKASLRAALARARDSRDVTSLEAVKSYIEVQRTRYLLGITRNNLKALGNIKHRIGLRAKAGFASAADLHQAQTQIEAAKLLVEDAQSQGADAMVVFETITRQPAGNLESPSIPRSALPQSLEQALRLASANSPRILALTYDASAAEAAIGIAKSAFRPKINLRLGLDYDDGTAGGSNSSESASAQIVFKYDLYDGGTRAARLSQNRYRALALQQDVLDTMDQVRQEIRLIWNAINSSQARLATLERKSNSARKALDLNLERFAAGKASLDVILTLQSEAASSEIEYLNEISTGRFNTYRILAVTGRLLPALGIRYADGGSQ